MRYTHRILFINEVTLSVLKQIKKIQFPNFSLEFLSTNEMMGKEPEQTIHKRMYQKTGKHF